MGDQVDGPTAGSLPWLGWRSGVSAAGRGSPRAEECDHPGGGGRHQQAPAGRPSTRTLAACTYRAGGGLSAVVVMMMSAGSRAPNTWLWHELLIDRAAAA
ncbi:hypothetical protein [Frankia gtarii]|uniref:hypothetical protein n=1 Tax=Frankia gtarii TaxID=2950102 RepID=UPI0021BE1256|nr:hypothetical protein [Frankia gtarii]